MSWGDLSYGFSRGMSWGGLSCEPSRGLNWGGGLNGGGAELGGFELGGAELWAPRLPCWVSLRAPTTKPAPKGTAVPVGLNLVQIHCQNDSVYQYHVTFR